MRTTKRREPAETTAQQGAAWRKCAGGIALAGHQDRRLIEGRVARMIGHNSELVAIVDMADDASEDQWAQTSWHAECAVVKAARSAGYAPEDTEVTWTSGLIVIARTADGNRYAARIRCWPGGPRIGVARQPSEHDCDVWSGRASQEEASESVPLSQAELVERRLKELEGETFRTKRGVTFTYTWLPSPYFVVRVSRNGRLIDGHAIARAVAQWPIAGPGELSGVPEENTYVYGIVRDSRVRGK